MISNQTLEKIAEDPEEFAREFLYFAGTDALEDFIDRVREVWDEEGSHK